MIKFHKNQFDHRGHLLRIRLTLQLTWINHRLWTQLWFTFNDHHILHIITPADVF